MKVTIAILALVLGALVYVPQIFVYAKDDGAKTETKDQNKQDEHKDDNEKNAQTPASSSNSGGGGGGSSGGGSSGCTSTNITTIPIIISSKRIDANTIFISWGPFAGLNQFVVQYGFQKDNLQFNTRVTGFSTSISSLPNSQQIFARVAATDNCAIGPYGPTIAVAGTTTNKNAPSFPGTGFEPPNKLKDVAMPLSLVGLLSYSLVLILKKNIL